MTRQPIRGVSQPNAIRPTAAPVNTYVRPADPAPSSLHDLAKGLASVDANLSGFLQDRRRKQEEADAIRGKAAFYRNNQQGFAEGVRQGRIPPQASPQFMAAYKRAQGDLSGVKLREEFNQAYLQWEGRNGADEAAFQSFLSGFISERVTSDDPDILEGLNPHLEALTNDALSAWGRDTSAATQKGSLDTRAAILGETIDYSEVQGLETGDGVNFEHLWADLMDQRERALSVGHRAEDFDRQMVEAIASKAVEHGDPELLLLLDRKLPGSEVRLSSLPEFREVKAATGDKLESAVRQRSLDAERQAEKEDKLREGRVVSAVSQALASDPSGEVPEEVLREWERYDPMARKKLVEMRRTFSEAVTLEDPRDLISVERMVQDGATVADVMGLVGDGTIRDPETFRKIVDRVERRRGEVGDILTTSTAKRYVTTLRKLTALPVEEEALLLYDPGGTTDEGLEAIRDFEEMLLKWREDNPHASIRDREKAIHEAGDMILSRVDRLEGSYMSEQDANDLRAEVREAVGEQP